MAPPDDPAEAARQPCRLVVVAPLSTEPLLRPGDAFTTRQWPLHVTLVPTFVTPGSPEQVGEALAAVSPGLPALRLEVGEDALFGPRHSVPVSLVVPTPALRAAHEALVAAVGDVQPETGDYWHGGFRAHVTHRPGHRVVSGDLLDLEEVALVDMRAGQPGGRRAVLAVSPLGARPGG